MLPNISSYSSNLVDILFYEQCHSVLCHFAGISLARHIVSAPPHSFGHAQLRYKHDMASDTSTFGQKLSRDDWKKKKELEEARKAGTAPAEVDEEGKYVKISCGFFKACY